MERINGSITAAIKSRKSPDANIETILEIDVQQSLLPYVIPGMESALARDTFCDADGRVLMHKVFREYVKTGRLGYNDNSDDDYDADGEDVLAQTRRRQPNNHRRKEKSSKVPSSTVLESLLTSSSAVMKQNSDLDREDIEREFGVRLKDADILRGLRKIGDVSLVDKVRGNRVLLQSDEYSKLKAFIKETFDDLNGVRFDFLFQPLETAEQAGCNDRVQGDNFGASRRPGMDSVGPVAGTDATTRGPVLEEVRKQDREGKLIDGQHHPAIKFTKWKNVRFENSTKMGRFVVDTRVVRISGSRFERANRIRTASFFEFSTDTSINSGSHTAGNRTGRSSSRRSPHPREFAQALFFMTVDFNWTLLGDRLEEYSELPDRLFLCFCNPLSTRSFDGLTVVNRVPLPVSIPARQKYKRKMKPARWLDVDDMVDIIGLIRCREDDFVCWSDACWDPVERKALHPLSWKYVCRPDYGPDPILPTSDALETSTFGANVEAGQVGSESEHEDAQFSRHSIAADGVVSRQPGQPRRDRDQLRSILKRQAPRAAASTQRPDSVEDLEDFMKSWTPNSPSSDFTRQHPRSDDYIYETDPDYDSEFDDDHGTNFNLDRPAAVPRNVSMSPLHQNSRDGSDAGRWALPEARPDPLGPPDDLFE